MFLNKCVYHLEAADRDIRVVSFRLPALFGTAVYPVIVLSQYQDFALSLIPHVVWRTWREYLLLHITYLLVGHRDGGWMTRYM